MMDVNLRIQKAVRVIAGGAANLWRSDPEAMSVSYHLVNDDDDVGMEPDEWYIAGCVLVRDLVHEVAEQTGETPLQVALRVAKSAAVIEGRMHESAEGDA